MRQQFLLSIAFIGFAFISFGQDISKNAIGLRLGDSDGFGAEISYQRAIGESNRFEFDLGWRNGKKDVLDYDGFKFAGLYQWVWNLDGGFNWYAGAGAGVSTFNINNNGGSDINDTFVFAAGDIGIEYNFDFPLLLSIDVRPELGFGDDIYDNDDLDFDIALSARYQF